jgi:hypothetical protein
VRGNSRTESSAFLQAAPETLAGPGYRLVEGPVHRLVSFERYDAVGPAAKSTLNTR